MAEANIRVRHFDEVESTNLLVKQALEAGEAEGLLCRAAAQSGGYGRAERSWSSPVGGLYQSLLLRPSVAPAALPTFSLVCALAIRRVLIGFSGASEGEILVKWPNDLMTADGKLVGISCETHGGGLCVGMGVNVSRPAGVQAVGGKNTPAYLGDLGSFESGDRASFIDKLGDAVAEEIMACYDLWQQKGFPAFADEYRRWDFLQGRDIQVALPDGAVIAQGVVEGIDETGRLLLGTSQGIQAFSSGEVHILQA